MMEKCASVKKEALEEAVNQMPRAQQESIKTCFASAKFGNAKSRRYTIAWIYECLLIRIKGRATYEHLRKVKLLPLPCVETLHRYIRHINGCYGFQPSIFNLLKKKSELMPANERRGTLLIDEMKLTEKITFEKKTLKINGFTDLGQYTPLHQKGQKGDHALVMMFQPFRGSWVQSVAAFLSKGCASSSILHHLIIEAVILLEKSGFFVDVVTTDGATWNRSMWKMFGITENQVSCEHPYDMTRRLWFSSDFPHLIKNFRNFVIKNTETWTPDGVVKSSHWEALIEVDQPKGLNLKLCPRLSYDDIHPKPYQKMNVGRAYRFFGEKTSAAMETYRSDHPNLKDCAPTLLLINKMAKLIKIMSSRTPIDNPIKPDSPDVQFIHQFVEYIQEWKTSAQANNFYFLSNNTFAGLIISLKATIEILSFLCGACDYTYLMTSRLNQDALERFFGMMRGACGSNDHPDSNLFIQMFKLLSTYSLVKPPKGSNVEGDEIFTTLINTSDILMNSDDTVAKFQESLDKIVDNCIWFKDAPFGESSEHDYCRVQSTFCVDQSAEFVIAYVGGYIARKACRFTKCETCLGGLKTNEPTSRDKFTALLSKGFLIYPSEPLFQLITRLESLEFGFSKIHKHKYYCGSV